MHDRNENAGLDFRVCAVVVTYHPAPGMREHLVNLAKQVHGLVVVDNGSTAEELGPLRVAAQSQSLTLIENGENLGIAEGLNQGVLHAKNLGFSWVILFDQDSKITDGFIEQMYSSWASHPNRDNIAAIHPRYIHPVTGVEPWFRRAVDGGPFTSMTSGCLMPSWVFDKIGPFASEYFIDMVDTEYSLRARAAGYQIIESQAILLHTAGFPQKHRLLGLIPFTASHHSVVRRYYMSRNRVVLFRQYWRKFPVWTGMTIIESLKDTMKCFVGEPDRLQKIRGTFLGIRDGIRGNLGRKDDLQKAR